MTVIANDVNTWFLVSVRHHSGSSWTGKILEWFNENNLTHGRDFLITDFGHNLTELRIRDTTYVTALTLVDWLVDSSSLHIVSTTEHYTCLTDI